MIKIMTPNRSVIGVTKVEPVVEKRLHFNGSDIRLCEVAKGTRQKITGLYLTADEKNLFPFASGNLLVCNLKPDLAESILRELLSVGYWDFSSLDYQTLEDPTKRYKYDGGASKPYYVDDCTLQMYQPTNAFHGGAPFGGMPSDGCKMAEGADEDDEGEDLSDMTDEELRRAIYERKDTAMLRLGRMDREELEKEYKEIEREADE